MKHYTIILFLSLLTSYSFSQTDDNRFRVDYNTFSYYDPETKTWSEWERADNTFIFNYNSRGDVAHLTPNGKTIIYKKFSDIETKYTKEDHIKYQICTVIDDEGDSIGFQVFDDTGLGLKMLMGDFIIQFAREE